jgi:hypothetical protein
MFWRRRAGIGLRQETLGTNYRERRHHGRSVIPDDKALALVCALKAISALQPGSEKETFMSNEIKLYAFRSAMTCSAISQESARNIGSSAPAIISQGEPASRSLSR